MGVNAQAVQQLYIAYFNRPADVGGLIYWENIVNTNKGDTSSISAEFAKSAEYIASFANLTNAEIVNQVYLNLFGRAAEEGGVIYWSNLLDKKAITIDNVVTQVSKGAQGTDLDAYNAKVSGALVFTANFSPDDAPFYKGTGPAQVAKNFITSIKDAASLTLATQTENLQTTFSLLVSSSYAPQASTLTTGLDNVVPTTETPFGGDDTFNANSSGTSQTLNVGDVINGGLGYNILNLTSTTQTALVLGGGINVSNIQSANINADNSANVDSHTWTGLKQLNLNSVGNTVVQAPASANSALTTKINLGSITVDGGNKVTINSTESAGTGSISVGNTTSPTGDVTIHNTSTLGGNAINVKGGANIYVTQDYTNANNIARTITGGIETITGSSATQIVSVNNQGRASNTVGGLSFIQSNVTITDANFASKTQAGSINTVSINGFYNATIQDSALTTLTLSDGGGKVKIDPGMLAPAPGGATLQLNLQDFGGELDISNTYTSVNINTGNLSGHSSSFGNLQDTALSTVTVSGAGSLSLGSLASSTALKNFNFTGSGRIFATFADSNITSINTQGATSKDIAFFIDGSKTSYVGGDGTDYVAASNDVTQNISLGAGNDTLDIQGTNVPTGLLDGGDGIDKLTLTASQLNTIATGNNTNIGSFESLYILGPLTGQTLDAAKVGAIQEVSFDNIGSYTVKNLVNGSHINLLPGGNTYSFTEIAHTPGKFNTISLALSNTTGSTTDYAAGGITLGNVEKASINLSYSSAAPNVGYDTLSLKAPSLAILTLSGNRGVNLIETDRSLNYVDARGVTAGGLSFTGGTGLVYVFGSTQSSATNNVDLSFGTQTIEYVGGDGSDLVTVNGNANLITVGKGNDSVTIVHASETLTSINTILDPHAGLTVAFDNLGTESFAPTKVTLSSSSATLQDYADAAIKQAHGSSTDGAFAWFQFSGSTYLIESRHSGSNTFISGVDGAVRLVGLFDLSHATFFGENFITLV